MMNDGMSASLDAAKAQSGGDYGRSAPAFQTVKSSRDIIADRKPIIRIELPA
jgi:hypothetical protein